MSKKSLTIVSQSIIEDSAQKDGRRYIRYEYTDHLALKHYSGLKLVLPGFDANEDLITNISAMETELALQEVRDAVSKAENLINPDKVAEHQAQADFDKRVLGRMMLKNDAHVFYAAYPMFQAVEGRGGANANQRATYLGITKADYDLIAARFNNVNGVAWFLNDEKNMAWNELPDVFN